MTGIVTAICVILIFGLIVFIHEFGHFITAKLFGVTVHEFAIGMGPKLFGKKYKETEYSVRLIPMGGYVKMEGEDEASQEDGAFSQKKPWQRFIILFAGAFMNLVLGFVLLVIMNAANPDLPVIPTMQIESVQAGMGAEQAGILPGDQLLRVEGRRVHTHLDLNLSLHEKESVSVTVKRNDETMEFTVPLTEEEGYRYLGIVRKAEEKNLWNVISYSFFEGISIIKLTYQSFFGMFTGAVSVNQMSGPVGIVNEIGTAVKSGIFDVLFIAILISLNLGVVNLFPLPALDGGRIVFVLWEMITRKKLKPEHEGIIHFIGFVILIGLVLYVTKNDVIRLFQK
ncbi:MAG: site-2 protease family protein [Clostridia bacterium]|nr:site-2 protease family protein [Clostridia bacterium]